MMWYSIALILFCLYGADTVQEIKRQDDYRYSPFKNSDNDRLNSGDPSLSYAIKRYIQQQSIRRNYYDYLKNRHLELIHPRYRRFIGDTDPGNRATITATTITSTPSAPPIDPAFTTQPTTIIPSTEATTQATPTSVMVDETTMSGNMTVNTGTTQSTIRTTTTSSAMRNMVNCTLYTVMNIWIAVSVMKNVY